MISKKIKEIISAEFTPLYLEVIDDTQHHNVSIHAQSHFSVILVSDQFSGVHVLNRHRSVYKILANQLEKSLHALALHIYSSEEWEELRDKVLSPPTCIKTRKH